MSEVGDKVVDTQTQSGGDGRDRAPPNTDHESVHGEKLDQIKKQRGGIKAIVTRTINEMTELMKGELIDKNVQRQLDKKYETLNSTAEELGVVNEKCIQMLKEEKDIQEAKDYMAAMTEKVQCIQYQYEDILAQSDEDAEKSKISPEDSASQVPSQHSRASNCSVQAAAKAAALAVAAAALRDQQELEFEEFKLKQRKETLKMRTQVAMAEA